MYKYFITRQIYIDNFLLLFLVRLTVFNAVSALTKCLLSGIFIGGGEVRIKLTIWVTGR